MNSELLYITRKLGYPSSFGTRAGLGDFLEQYPDGVYAENGGGAPIGWESAAVWFGGDSERSAARFERMMSERNELSRIFRTRVAGVLVLTFIYRIKSRMVTAIPILGGQPQPSIDPTWLYFTTPEGGTVTLTKYGTPTAVTLEYSLDNGNTWNEWIETGNVRSLTLAEGQTMHVRNASDTSTRFSTGVSNYYNFAFTSYTYVGGNTNSLLCNIPINAAVTVYCYYKLFYGCTSLNMDDTFTLPATTLATSCYAYMFFGCTGLTMNDVFTLPATTLDNGCYSYMFYNCTGLAMNDVFTLPATTLADNCFSGMFYGCTSLNMNDVFTIQATTLADGCCYNMFRGCTSLAMNDVFTLPATTLATSCYSYMFYGCTNLAMNDVFTLPATTLATSCYAYMFRSCTRLNIMRTNMTDISAANCITDWLRNVSPTGDFYCPAELTIPTGVNGIPSGWTRHDI